MSSSLRDSQRFSNESTSVLRKAVMSNDTNVKPTPKSVAEMHGLFTEFVEEQRKENGTLQELVSELTSTVAGVNATVASVNATAQETSGRVAQLVNSMDTAERELNARLSRLETRPFDQQRLKDAARDAVEEDIEEVVDGIKGSRPVRLLKALGRELKPGIPRHDHVKGATLGVGSGLMVARYVPFVREVVINVVTP